MSSPYNPDDFDRDGMPIKHKNGHQSPGSPAGQGSWQMPQNPPRFGETSFDTPMGNDSAPTWQQAAEQDWREQSVPAPMNNAYGFAQGMSPVSDKNWILALVLLLVGGGFGVHNFYLGKMNHGIGQLGLNIVGWVLFVSILGIPFALVSWGLLSVWLFVEFLMLIINGGTDGNGRPMRP